MIFIIGSIFIGLIFVSSYFELGNNNSSTTPGSLLNNSSNKNCTGTFAINETNAIIVNYSSNFILAINKSFNANEGNAIKTSALNIANISNVLNNTLSTVNSTNNISFTIINNNTYDVLLSNMSAYNFQQIIYQKLQSYNYNNSKSNVSNLVNLKGATFIKLPHVLSFKPYSSVISQRAIIKNQTYSINIYPLRKINSTIPVEIQALMNKNGICQNSIRINSN